LGKHVTHEHNGLILIEIEIPGEVRLLRLYCQGTPTEPWKERGGRSKAEERQEPWNHAKVESSKALLPFVIVA